MRNNRKRILAEAVALDAWHDPFSTDGKSVGVYVELSFKEGRLGGNEVDLPFTFKVGLKRALLTVSLESPLQIDRKSIARSLPEISAELTRILAAKESAESQLKGTAKLNPAALHLALSGESKKASEVSQSEQMKIVQTIPETLVLPRPVDAQSYSWSMEPSWNPVLRGQPWDPVGQPRMLVKPTGALAAVMPAIRAELSCALEDVTISDIRRKPLNSFTRVGNLVIGATNEAAAQQYLKIALRDADLEPGELDNRFSNLLLASVLATPE